MKTCPECHHILIEHIRNPKGDLICCSQFCDCILLKKEQEGLD